MTTTAQCPACGNPQAQGLLDDACTTKLERSLGDVRWIVTELDIAASKMARIGNPSGGGGLARERNPISWGAVEAADTLGNVLTTWCRDIHGHPAWSRTDPATAASRGLLDHIDAIRRHPAVAELLDEITDAVEQARRAIDRPADRQYLGQCLVEVPSEEDDNFYVTCYAELWGRPDATEVSCRVCGIEHSVRDRREWLVAKAAEMVVTAREASHYLSDVGALNVSEMSIRNWVKRKKILLRPGLSDQRTFELGALMDYIRARQPDTTDVVLAELPLAV